MMISPSAMRPADSSARWHLAADSGRKEPEFHPRQERRLHVVVHEPVTVAEGDRRVIPFFRQSARNRPACPPRCPVDFSRVVFTQRGAARWPGKPVSMSRPSASSHQRSMVSWFDWGTTCRIADRPTPASTAYYRGISKTTVCWEIPSTCLISSKSARPALVRCHYPWQPAAGPPGYH